METDATTLPMGSLRARVMASLALDAEVLTGEPSNLNSREGSQPTRALHRRWYSKAAALIAAAGLLIAAFLAGRFDNVAFADASDVLRAAKVTHADPIERVYVMTTRKSDSSMGEFRIPNDVRVHVLGDRFWVEMSRGDRHWVWGRNESGEVWIVAGNGRAMTIAPDEIGPVLGHVCDLCSLNTETLLDDVLANCRLDRSDADSSVHRIEATANRMSRTGIRTAVLDIDRETKALRRLKIERMRPPRIASTVEFVLVDSIVADEARYSVEGHAQNSQEVMSRGSRFDRRRELLSSFLGVSADRWILPGVR
jgi:hypothetical protein